jgi:hypothetical protein
MAQRPGTLPGMGFRTDRHSTAAVCSAAPAQIAVSANPPPPLLGKLRSGAMYREVCSDPK